MNLLKQNKIFHYRKRIPKDLKVYFNKNFFLKTLHTKKKFEAEKNARLIDNLIEELFQKIRHLILLKKDFNTITEIINDHLSNKISLNKTKEEKEICLITPPSPFLMDERVFINLGILKVASSLESKGYDVDFLDLSGVKNYRDVIKDYCNKYKKKKSVFGITATTPQIRYAVEIASLIKSIKPISKIVLGGPHVTLMHSSRKREFEDKLRNKDRATNEIARLSKIFDVLVCGDGELSIFEAIKMEKGIIDADDKDSSLFLTNDDFTELPFPARHLVDIKSYKYEIEKKNATHLIAQLGCPFHCTFCSGRNSPFLRKIRTRTQESIISELRHLYKKYSYTGFMFYDDELNVNRKAIIPLMNAITDLQEELGVSFSLRGFVKAELFDKEQAKAMQRAGFKKLLSGFESGDPRILLNIKKRATLDDNTRCLETAKKYGIKVKALMSIGHAGESHKTIENTKNWLLKMDPEEFDCTIITTYPGSPYFDESVKQGEYYTYTSDITGDKLYQSNIDYLSDIDYYKGDPNGGYISYVWTDYLKPNELAIARGELEKEIRKKLEIKYDVPRPGITYEHSMGMGLGNVKMPNNVFKKTNNTLNT